MRAQVPDPHASASAALVVAAARDMAAIRQRRPLVHCLTNQVAANLSANLLLAAGAVPSMTAEAEAMPEFIAGSAALVVNLGMLDPGRLAAAERAAPLAQALGKPWALDPVKVERSPSRLAVARRLLKAGPAVVRANRGEAAALAGVDPAEAGPALAHGHGLVAAITGPVDEITDGERTLRLANGSPLMDRVTGMGCAGTALLGAFLAVDPDPFSAAAAALLVLGVAGEIAAERAAGPGSFVPAFLDAVFNLNATALETRTRFA